MKFAVIIPDRNDRPELLQHCKEQIAAQTLKPEKVYLVNYPAKSDDIDLVQRVKMGVEYAKRDSIDLVFVIENDDLYPFDYFERFQPFFDKYEFFGDQETTYYNLKNKTYKTFTHPYRSSLFTTGFKISSLNNFDWPADNARFLDISLWQYARHRKKIFVNTGAVGMKHGIGRCGGKGHVMRFKDVDVDLKYLRSRANGSFEFYQRVMNSL